MKNWITVTLLIFIPFFASAKTFYFLGVEDSYYANPANWSPTYPGNTITSDDIVIIQSNTNFDGFDIVVQGKLFVELGQNLNSAANGIKIETGGILNNEGEIATQFVQNSGKIVNGLYAIIFSEKYYTPNKENVNGLVYSQFSAPEFEETNYASAVANDESIVSLSMKRGMVTAPSQVQNTEKQAPIHAYMENTNTKKKSLVRRIFSK